MRIIYHIGKHSKRFRTWYYRRTGRWWWGILGFAQGFTGLKPTPLPWHHYNNPPKAKGEANEPTFNWKRMEEGEGSNGEE